MFLEDIEKTSIGRFVLFIIYLTYIYYAINLSSGLKNFGSAPTDFFRLVLKSVVIYSISLIFFYSYIFLVYRQPGLIVNSIIQMLFTIFLFLIVIKPYSANSDYYSKIKIIILIAVVLNIIMLIITIKIRHKWDLKVRNYQTQYDSLNEDYNEKILEFNELENKKEAMIKKQENYQLLEYFSRELLSTLNIKDIFNLITFWSYKIINEGIVELYLINMYHNRKQFELASRYSQNLDEKYEKKTNNKFPVLNTIEDFVVKKGTVIIEDMNQDIRFMHLKNTYYRGIVSIIAASISQGDKVVGVLRIISNKKKAFDNNDMRLLSVIGTLSSLAMNRCHLFEQTQLLSITDGLTKLYVHRHFQELLDLEIKRADSNKSKLSLMMIDIDDFKKVNDTYGHMVGDEILSMMSKEIKKSIREIDIPSRYGGEEFTIILPETDMKGAVIVAERIKKSVKNSTYNLDGKSIKISVSIGIAIYYLKNFKSKNDFINASDKALYEAKRMGKDKIIVF